jgi:hypothetical protein
MCLVWSNYYCGVSNFIIPFTFINYSSAIMKSVPSPLLLSIYYIL